MVFFVTSTLPTSDLDPKVSKTTLSIILVTTDIALDTTFGFALNPPVRIPFDTALQHLRKKGLMMAASAAESRRGRREGIGTWRARAGRSASWISWQLYACQVQHRASTHGRKHLDAVLYTMREQLNFDTNIVNRIYRQQELKKKFTVFYRVKQSQAPTYR
jgi:hypothetical protein